MKSHMNRVKGISRFFLCMRIAATVCLCFLVLPAQSGGITTKDQKAKEALDTAVKALGGADKIGEIKSLIIKGTQILILHEGLGSSPGVISSKPTPREFEIRILLPDSFIRIDNPTTTNSGFGVSGGMLIPPIQLSVVTTDGNPSPEKMPGLEESIVANRLNERIDEWSRFLIGTLMQSGPSPLTLSSASKPGVFSINKKDGVAGEIEFDSKTCYPSVIRYNAPRRTMVAESGNAFDGEMRFQDRFSVNGIMFPRTITTFEPENPTRELRIEEVQINPKLSLADFEIYAGKPLGKR